MTRYASWVVNAALLVVACFLLAQSVNTVFAALLTDPPAGKSSAPAETASPPLARTWKDRELILTRNLFNASTLTPEPGSAATLEPEVLEATQLPLNLLGTAAADVPELSWAAIEDRDTQQTLVLRIGDSVRNAAQVKRIERKRIVLEENGVLRELALAEPEGVAAGLPAPPRPPARTAARRPGPTPRAQPAPPPAPEPGARTPAQLFSEARILPKYEEGQMVGVQISSIKPGSLFERIGIEEGDVITELNGIRIDSPEQSAKILLELTSSETFKVQVRGPGGIRDLDVAIPEP
jgi:general secretion pathway protein C